MAPSGTANDTAASNQHNLLSPASATSNASSKSSRRSLQGLVKSFRRGKSKKRNNTTDSGSDNTPSMIEIGESPEKLLLPPESVDTDSTTSTLSSSVEQQQVLTTPPAAAGSTNPTESIASSQTNRSSSSTMASSKDVVIVKPIDDDDNTTTTSLDLVVLLMHPVSHRFELVQLEFADGKKAKVSDLLGQIPVSVTEECLKSQLYDSILDQDSTDPGRPRVHGSTRLIEAFGGGGGENNSDGTTSRKMVLVARPQGITDHDALKMAKPIFTNKDILSMVRKKNETQKSIG